MSDSDGGKQDTINRLFSALVIPDALFRDLDLAGARPCSLLLQAATRYQRDHEWERCQRVAFKAQEFAWEQLHSGPSWQAVAQVHRDAYGLAGLLLALAVFKLNDGGSSLQRALYTLDLVALMAGGHFRDTANMFIERMEACMKTEMPTALSMNVGPKTREGDVVGQRPKKARCNEPDNAKRTRGKASTGRIRRIPLPPLEVFRREFMETATPVILTDVMEGWPALGQRDQKSRDWSNPTYLRAVAGRRTVPIEFGGSYTGDGWRQELMNFGEFIGRFIEADGKDETEVVGADINQGDAGKGSRDDEEEEVRSSGSRRHPCDPQRSDDVPNGKAYLAQHELFDQIPALRRDIMTPDYCSLLLNDEESDASAASVATNAWFGPAGTISPLHNDPFHNLLAQVVGSKRVLMVNRELSAAVYPRPGLMNNTSQVDAANPDLSLYPKFADVMPLLECELERGEMLYIPPLFWHHIESLSVSFSVSFWWGRRRTLGEGQLPRGV